MTEGNVRYDLYITCQTCKNDGRMGRIKCKECGGYGLTKATPEEIKEAMPDAMHWLPMSDDAVFDRSESMLFRLAKYDTTDASGIYHGTYLDMVETYRPFITHYARITEPK